MRTLHFIPFLVLSVAAGAAQCGEVVFDFTTMGTFTTTNLGVSPMYVVANGPTPVPKVNVSAQGLGVVGGALTDALDGSERLEFGFAGHAAFGVHYEVESGGFENGNGTSADAVIEAFGANYASLGTVGVHGIGDHDVSELFHDAPITFFRVTAQGDSQRISSLRYNAPHVADFKKVGTLTGGVKHVWDGVEVGTHNGKFAWVTFSTTHGLGADQNSTSNDFPNAIDDGEVMTFRFVDGPVEQVSWTVSFAVDADADGQQGEVIVVAVDGSGTQMGTVIATTGVGTWKLRSYFPWMSTFSEFRLYTQAPGDALSIGSVSFMPVSNQETTLDAATTMPAMRFLGDGVVAHAANGSSLASLSTATGVGLGVTGGASNASIEGAEAVVCFTTGCAAGAFDVVIGNAVDGDGDFIAGEGTIEAFDSVGVSQGVVAISGAGAKSLGHLFPGPLFSGCIVRASGSDRLSLTRIRIREQPGMFAFPFYGNGCIGSGPLPRTLCATALSQHSGHLMNVSIANAPPSQLAYLFLGLNRVEIPAGYGCPLFVAPPIGPLGPIPLDANGELWFSAQIPTVAFGVTITLQAFTTDPASPGGFSTTNGVELNFAP